MYAVPGVEVKAGAPTMAVLPEMATEWPKFAAPPGTVSVPPGASTGGAALAADGGRTMVTINSPIATTIAADTLLLRAVTPTTSQHTRHHIPKTIARYMPRQAYRWDPPAESQSQR